MLDIIRSVDWEPYRVPNPDLDIPRALENLNSDKYAERVNALEALVFRVERSLGDETEMVFDLVPVLFKFMQLTEFKYKDMAGELLLICGTLTETNVADNQRRLKNLLCEQLALNSSISEDDFGKENKEYLESICGSN